MINVLPASTKMKLIAALLGEFNCRGRVGVYGVSLQFHKSAHSDFESRALQVCFDMGMEMLRTSITSLHLGSFDADVVTSALLLLNELLVWEFGNIDLSAGNDRTDKEVESLSLPSEWASALLDTAFVNSIFWVYSSCRDQIIGADSIECTNLWSNAMSTAKDIVLELCSFSGRIFHSQDDKKNFVEILLKHLSPMLATSLDGIANNQIKVQELKMVASAFYKIVLNFKVAAVCQSTQLAPFMQGMHMVTLQLSKSILMSSNQLLQQLLNGEQLDSLEDLLFDDWRWQVLEQVLDTWGAILTDAVMVTYRIDKRGHIPSDARQFILQAASLFSDVMSAVMTTVMVDSLASSNEEEVDEVERLAYQRLVNCIASVCMLGRASILDSLHATLSVIEGTMTEMNAAVTQMSISPLQSERMMESLRICILILIKLVSDAEEGVVDLSSGSDASVIPGEMLDKVAENPSMFPPSLKGAYSVVCRVLESQLRLIRLPGRHPLYSQVIVAACLRFLQLFILAYVEPEESLYSADTVQSFTGLFHASDPEITSSCEFLCGMALTLVENEGFNEEIIGGVAGLLIALSQKYTLREASVHSNDFRILWVGLVEGQGIYRLCSESYSHVYYALAHIALRGEDDDVDKFALLCQSTASDLLDLTTKVDDNLLHNWLGKFSGIAKCSADRNGVFAKLLIDSLPLLMQIIPAYSIHDSVVRAIVDFLSIIVERHLFALRPAPCLYLYNSSRLVVAMVADRLSKPVPAAAPVREEEESFRCELLAELLGLLCNLGTKEYFSLLACAP